MRPWVRSLLPLLAAIVPFAIAAACSSSDPSNEDSVHPGTGGAAGTAGHGGAGQGGKVQGGEGGSTTAGVGGSDAGQGGSTTAGAGGDAAGAGGDAGQGGSGAGSGGSTTAGAGGSTTAGAGGDAAGAGGSATAGAGGSTTAGAGGSTAGAGGSTTAGAGGQAQGGAGQGGTAGSGGGWPTCDEQPLGSEKTSVSAVWTDNPKDYKPVWLEGLTVTAISFGACNAGTNFQCLVFLQTQPNFKTLTEGKHQGIKLFVSAKASPYFSKLGVGDVVNLYGNAIRYTAFGNNELRVHVDLEHPGCFKKVGSAEPTPIQGVALDDLTIDNYENEIGPLLVQVDTVKGRPLQDPSKTFALFESEVDGGSYDAGLELTQVLTPYYLPGSKFQGLTPDIWTQFSSIAGVYSVFVVSDNGQNLKYRMLGPRIHSEIVVKNLPHCIVQKFHIGSDATHWKRLLGEEPLDGVDAVDDLFRDAITACLKLGELGTPRREATCQFRASIEEFLHGDFSTYQVILKDSRIGKPSVDPVGRKPCAWGMECFEST